MRIWQTLLKGDLKPAVFLGLSFTLLATLVTFAKAILEYIFLLFLLPFVVLMLISFFKKKFAPGWCAFIFLMQFLIIFCGALHTYRSLNERTNGYFTLTDYRGPYMFYHYAVKRTDRMDKDHFLSALLMIPGEGVCRAVYGQRCKDWWWDAYPYAIKKSEELKKMGVKETVIFRELIKEGVKVILLNPLPYSLFMSFETLKLLFWESTKIGYVVYPPWLKTLHDNIFFKSLLRFFVFFITAFSLLFLLRHLFTHRRLFFEYAAHNEKTHFLFLALFFMIIFMFLYSSVIVITRYAFPIVPFYLIAIAFALNNILPPDLK